MKSNNHRWLGGSDAALEDDWRWVGSGNAFDYSNWARDLQTEPTEP